MVLDVVEADDALALGDEERAVLEGDAVGCVQALGDADDVAVIAAVDKGIDLVA